jgi:hypothetical protein
MADYLFREALGVAPSKDVLRAAKNALMPLRGHPGWSGWAVIVLLEGSESRADYDNAVSALLHAARGGNGVVAGSSSELAVDRESASVVSLRPRLPGGQLAFPGLDA